MFLLVLEKTSVVAIKVTLPVQRSDDTLSSRSVTVARGRAIGS